MITVVFFQRKRLAFHNSIEYIFDDVRSKLQGKIISTKKVFSYYSTGIMNRARIMLEARASQGDVNHITGDIHFATILLDRRKTILTIHDCGMLSNSRGLKHFILRLFWFRLPLKKCRFLTVVSHFTKTEVLKHVNYPEKNIHVIPVAVSPLFSYRSKIFNTKCPVILQFSSTANKNIERVVEAVSTISCQLVIIGHLTTMTKQLLINKQVRYENYENISSEELVQQYEKSDIVCFASTYEGFGMPIVEAQSIGRPVVTSKVSSMPEIAGGAAYLVDPYDINDIRNGILKIINDKAYREYLVEHGLINCKRFNPEVIANQYLELYEKIVERRI